MQTAGARPRGAGPGCAERVGSVGGMDYRVMPPSRDDGHEQHATNATAAGEAARRQTRPHRLMVISQLMERLPRRALVWIVAGWVAWIVALSVLPLSDTAMSTAGLVNDVLIAALYAAVIVEWAARLAHTRRDFATDLADTRSSRLALRACALVASVGFLVVSMPLADDRYLTARRGVLAVVAAACAAAVSIAVKHRRRRRAGGTGAGLA